MLALDVLFIVLTFSASLSNGMGLHGHQRRSHKNLPVKRALKCPNRPHPPTIVAPALVNNSSSTTTTTTPTTTADPTSNSTSSSSSSQPTSSSSIPTQYSLMDALFPVSIDDDTSWSTAPNAPASLPLSDATLNPEKVLQGLTHSYVDAPDGTKSMQAHYPAGSYNFQHDPLGGFSFYAPGPDNVDITTGKEVVFGYSVYFPDGFDFQKGGKLPGLYGGDSDSIATGCSGGRRDVRCWSTRLMFRTDGAGEFYTYLPPYDVPGYEANEKQCNVAPYSECNPVYGASVGRGSFTFATGAWTTVSQRIRLNDVNQTNGEIELFANGQSVVNVSGLILRDSEEGKFRGMQMQTFFGGSTPDFASPITQDAYFADFSLGITETL